MSDISFEELSHTKAAYWWLYGAGTILLILAIFLWWTRASVGAERVFWGMIDNSMRTAGVTTQLTEENQGTKVRQTIQYSPGNTNQAHAITLLTQGSTKIKTEIVGNSKQTFTRYKSIATDKKNEQGQDPALKSVIGVWAKTDDSTDAAAHSEVHLLSQAALGVGLPMGAVPVPMGQISAAEREKIIQKMREQTQYQVSYDKVKKERKDGKLLYTYEVKMQPILYLDMMKRFAKTIGLHDLDQLEANSYASAQPFTVRLTVDAHAKRLVRVVTESGYQQAYTGYDVPTRVSLPRQAISSVELLERLSKIQ